MMNLKRYLSFVVLLFFTSVSIIARQLTADEALARLHKNAAKYPRAKAHFQAALHLKYTATRDGVNLFYLFDNDNEGNAVILSADDLLPTVLAYGLGQFNIKEMPENVRSWMEYYKDVASSSIRRNISLSVSLPQGDVVEPLLKTKWSQSEPYNNLCSEKVGQTVPAGCVATSMAQVMNYWHYPITGKSSHSYYLNDNCELSAYFRTTTYDWNNMQYAYGNYIPEGETNIVYADYTAEQADAIAVLMYHCGVAVEMQYSKDNSGTSPWKQFEALLKYFDYDKGLQIMDRSWFTDDEWHKLLLNELYAKRPVIYGGSTVSGGGHSFVCDGFDGNGYFHFNWGWSGKSDGYFLVTGTDPLHPKQQGTGGSARNEAFTVGQIALMGIQPAVNDSKQAFAMLAANEQNISQDGRYMILTDETGKEVEDAVQRRKIYHIEGGFFNYSFNTLKAELGAILRNTETGEEYVCGMGEVEEMKSLYGVGHYDIKLDAITENGTYEVYPAFKTMNDGTLREKWKKMYHDSSIPPYIITIDGDTPTMQIDKAELINYNGYITELPELSVTVRALKDISDIKLSANVYNSSGTQVNAFIISSSLSMNAGEVKKFDHLTLRNNKRDKKLEPDNYYVVKITSSNYPYVLGNMEYTTLTCCVGDNLIDEIKTIQNTEYIRHNEKVGYYDLTGRQVLQPNKGIYIRNGKKVLK